MAIRSRNLNVHSVGSNPERILRGSWIPAVVIASLQNQNIKGHLPALRATELWLNQNAQLLQVVAPDTSEKEIKEGFEMPDEDHIAASETSYATLEDVKTMMGAAFKVHEKTKVQHLIDDFVEKIVLNVLKEAHDKTVTSTYTEL